MKHYSVRPGLRARIPGGPAQPGEPGWPGDPRWPGGPRRPDVPVPPGWPATLPPAEVPISPTRVWMDPHADWKNQLYERLLQRRIVLATGILDDDAAARLSAQLLTLDAEGKDPVRLELQNVRAELTAALTVMGILDVMRAPVQACVSGEISGPGLGILVSCQRRLGYPERLFCAHRAEADVRWHGHRAQRPRTACHPDARHLVLQAGRGHRPRGRRDPRRRAPRPLADDGPGHWLRPDPGPGNLPAPSHCPRTGRPGPPDHPEAPDQP